MKAIRIFLLVLIIIGVIALLTQKVWVPKLVNHIITKEGVPTAVQPTQRVITLTDGQQCYAYSQVATKTAPYAVTEFLDITIDGTRVNGMKTGTQNGPDMTNGYSGTITGTLNDNTITDVYSYVVEGAHNQEQEVYRPTVTGLEKVRYPLIEANGILVPDTTQQPTVLHYSRVGCTPSD